MLIKDSRQLTSRAIDRPQTSIQIYTVHFLIQQIITEIVVHVNSPFLHHPTLLNYYFNLRRSETQTIETYHTYFNFSIENRVLIKIVKHLRPLQITNNRALGAIRSHMQTENFQKRGLKIYEIGRRRLSLSPFCSHYSILRIFY